jgi:uncharacterized protein YjbI with pentapeptide repeats
MRLNRLALAAMAVSFSWAAVANPAVNNSVSGTVSTTAATQMVGGAAQGRLDGARLSGAALNGASLNGAVLNGDGRASSRASSSAAQGMSDSSVPSGWLMALVTVLLIGHQLRRKHRFLRPHRFSDF